MREVAYWNGCGAMPSIVEYFREKGESKWHYVGEEEWHNYAPDFSYVIFDAE
jgi:hypothetical protein